MWCVCSHGNDENVRWCVCSHRNDQEKVGGVCVCSHGNDENVRWRVCSHGNDEEKLGGVCVSEEEGGGWGSCSVCAVPSTGKGITAKGVAMSHFMCQCDWVTGRPR